MSKCDVKTSAQAWNQGLDAFKKAFKQTGGKTTESIKYAIDEINRQNPDMDFEVSSFTDPLIKSLKQKGIVGSAYTFNKNNHSGNGTKKKIEKVTEKMKTLSTDQKKSFAHKSFLMFEKEGMLTDESVKNIYADAIGIPSVNEKLDQQINSLAKARQAVAATEKSINDEIVEMQKHKTENNGKLSPEKDKEYSEKFNSLGEQRLKAQSESMKQASKFANMMQEKKFWLHQLTDYMPLNLMNPNSLIKNVSGAVADGIVRTIGNTLSSPISQAVSIFTKINSNPIGARVRGVAKAGIASKASNAWKYGVTDFQEELPRANYLDASGRIKKAMDDTGFSKWKGIISGILKIHPSLISKVLTVSDAVAYEMVKSEEINRIAEAKGLKGAEKEAFILKPDDKSEEISHTLAKRATFKQDLPNWLSGIKNLSSYDPHEQTKKLIEAGMSPTAAKIKTGIRAMIQKSAVPFIKTPINIVRTSSGVLLPEYEFADSMMKAYKETDPIEKQRLIIDGTTKAVAGFLVRQIAFNLIAKGLISAGYSDEDKKTKDIVEQETGGPNRINYSALVRGLTFRNTDKQKGDQYADLNSLGALGICMAVYAHAFNRYDKEDIKNRTSYSKNLINTASIPWNLARSSASSSLDFTFFTGVNQLQGAIMNKEGYEADQLATNYIANLFTGIAPATYQKLSTQYSPEVKKQFDKDLSFHENLVNSLGYRFAFQSKDLKNKYYSLAEKGGSALKKKEHVLFNNYLGRALEAEFDFAKLTQAKSDDNPISRLYQASREVPKEQRDKLFPSAINDQVSIKKGKKSVRVQLDEKQHEYLQQQASVYRMIYATPFIMSKDFKEADPELRAKALQSLYREGLDHAKKDLKSNNPGLTKTQRAPESGSAKKAKRIVKRYHVKESDVE